MLAILPGFSTYLTGCSAGGCLPAFNEIVATDRVLAADVQSAVEGATVEISGTPGASILYVIHTPKETSPLRISEDIPSLNQRRCTLVALLEKGIPLVVLHNPSADTAFYKENRERYSSLCDVITREPLEGMSGATLFVTFPGMAEPFFYFEITASQIDASSPNMKLAIKFGDSSDERIIEAAHQRVKLLESVSIEKSGCSEKVSFSEFLATMGLTFPAFSKITAESVTPRPLGGMER